ncbi:hypothetical protein [uncultured Legionella sp.]|uniref:hypothetical protein n=1 Tax=uncultured Legionella sp. TaxID=210934 RepID=UPI002628B99A|nr:hypothetical protein [uncultured Legionella sp.]
MPRFDVNKLVVLHLYNYIKPKGEQDPLVNLERKCNGVKVSTCMRIILIIHSDSLISDEQIGAYNVLSEFLNKKDVYSANIFFERLEGTKAYEFLLYWMLGGINPKRPFDDTRILGNVRDIWNKSLASSSSRAQILKTLYSTFFQCLFTDSTNLIKLLDIYNGSDKADKLKMACINCAWAREKGLLSLFSVFYYQSFAENTHLSCLESSLKLVEKKILDKAILSELSMEVSFFKSKHNMSPEQLDGVTNQLKTIKYLLGFLNSLKTDNTECINEATAQIGVIDLTDDVEVGLGVALAPALDEHAASTPVPGPCPSFI